MYSFMHTPGFCVSKVYEEEVSQPDLNEITAISDPNRLQLSEVENPFSWPARNSYRIGEDRLNEIIDIAVQSFPTSEGQFGEYPLIVGATNGIYLVNQGTGNVVYSNVMNISRLKPNRGMMGIDGAIIFTTKDGLFILQGRTVNELNRYLISNIIYDTEDTETPENPHGDTSGGLQFLQDAKFAWDNQHREIIVAKPGEDYHYRFNPELGIFFAASGSWDDFMLLKGVYYGYNIAETDISIYDLDQDNDDDEIRIYFKTNPQLLTAQDFKKIQRLILYCDVQTDSYYGYLNLFVFGGNIINSTTGYVLLQENKVDASKHPVHLITGRTPVSMRYFVFMLSGKVDKDSVIQHMEADITGVLPGRLR